MYSQLQKQVAHQATIQIFFYVAPLLNFGGPDERQQTDTGFCIIIS